MFARSPLASCHRSAGSQKHVKRQTYAGVPSTEGVIIHSRVLWKRRLRLRNWPLQLSRAVDSKAAFGLEDWVGRTNTHRRARSEHRMCSVTGEEEQIVPGLRYLGI